MSRFHTQLAAGFGLLLMALPAFPQRSTGTILGIVTDSTGGAVPGAAITVSNLDTGLVRTIDTGVDGLYAVTLLPVGRYQVKAVKTGFQEAVVKEVILNVNENVRVNLGLNVGAVTDSVTIEATSPMLKTDSATISQVVDEKRIVDMPLNGRNFQQLALLTPGVAVGGNFYGGAGYFTGFQLFAVNGSHPDKTQYSFDGGDVTEQEIGGPTFAPPIDTIQEFSVMSEGFSAEFGHGGGVINLVTKSGTNSLHGTLWEFLRNDVASARNFFARARAPLKRNQYGYGFGGPILRDRTFFYTSFEATNLRTADTFVQTVPTSDMQAGNFSALTTPIFDPATSRASPVVPGQVIRDGFPGNVIPANRIDSVASYFLGLKVYPLPNQSGLVNNFITNGPTKQDVYQMSARIDHRLTSKDSIFGRFSWYRSEINFPGGLEPSVLGKRTQINPAKNGLLNWIHTFSPSVQVEARVNVMRNNPIVTSPIVGIDDFTAKSGIEGFAGISSTSPGYPTFNWSGYATFNGLTFNPNERTNTAFNYIGNVSWIKGHHQMKFGTEVRKFNYSFYLAGVPRGSWSFDGRYTNDPNSPSNSGNSVADFLLGLPTSGDRYRTLDRFYYAFPDVHFYAQDDFKVRPNLTINFGLRYDLILPTTSSALNISNWDPSLKAPSGAQGAIVVPTERAITNSRQFITAQIYPIYKGLILFADKIPGYPYWLVDTNWKNFGPRFGFSWSPLRGLGLVVRGGYGIFYALPNGNIQNIFAQTPFLAREQGVVNDSPIPSRTLKRYFGAATFDPIPTVLAGPRYQPTPYEQHVNFGFQYEFTKTLVLDATYVGNLSRHLETQTTRNTPQPGPGPIQDRRPYPNYREVSIQAENFGATDYHALQLKAEKRLTHGLTFLTAYTLSKQTGFGFSAYHAPMDPYNRDRDRSVADFDMPNNFTASLNYQLPLLAGGNRAVRAALGEWELGTIFVARSGLPFNPTQSGDPANTGRSTRPYRIGVGTLSNPAIDRWFDPSAFAVVPANSYRYGNSGRNILRGPGTVNLDFSLYKAFRYRDRFRWQFRAEFFNLPNHANFGLPFTNISIPARAGQITSAAAPRISQFGLKMFF